MKVEKELVGQLLRNQWFWWLFLGAIFTVIYFSLLWNADDTGQLSMSLLFYFCAVSILRERWKDLYFGYSRTSFLLVVPLIAWLLLNSSPQTDPYTVRLFPFVAGIAIAILASGSQNLRQYWRELTIFFFLGVPSFFAYHLLDIAPLTAKFSTLLLWYTGFDVSSRGTLIALADSRLVEVVPDCSGLDMMNYLLGMSVICLIMFPISGWLKQALFAVASVLTGFVVNGFRVALMVVLAKFDQHAFENWHTGTGSYTFALLGIVILGLAYYWLLAQQNEAIAPGKE